MSPRAKDFIDQALVKDPTERPTAETCYSHKWIDRRKKDYNNNINVNINDNNNNNNNNNNNKNYTCSSRRVSTAAPSLIGSRVSPSRRKSDLLLGKKYQDNYTDMMSCTNGSDDNTFVEESSEYTTKSVIPPPPLCSHQQTKTSSMFINNNFVLPESGKRISKADLESTDASTTASTCGCTSTRATVDGREDLASSKETLNVIQVKEQRIESNSFKQRCSSINSNVKCPSVRKYINVNKINNIISESEPNNSVATSSFRGRDSTPQQPVQQYSTRQSNNSVLTTRSRHLPPIQRIPRDQEIQRISEWVGSHIKR